MSSWAEIHAWAREFSGNETLSALECRVIGELLSRVKTVGGLRARVTGTLLNPHVDGAPPLSQCSSCRQIGRLGSRCGCLAGHYCSPSGVAKAHTI